MMTAADHITPDDAHSHALALAAVGLRVLPIRAGTQHPTMNSWPHAATNNPATIDNWFKGLYRTAGVGLAMGPQPSGDYLFAIDVDMHDPSKNGFDELADLEAEHGPLPDTWRSITGRAGQHQIFKAPDGLVVRNQQASGNRIAPGIDVRGDGGQIVVAPTIHPKSGRAYAWEHGYEPWTIEVAIAPDWLVEIVREVEPTPNPIPTTHSSDPTSPSNTVFDLQRADWDWHTELMRRGWNLKYQHGGDTYWTRPGKDVREGHSAVLHGTDGPFVVFTTDIPAQWTQAGSRTRDGSGWSFGPFGFYAATEHGGDRSQAARALYAAYGVEAGDSGDLSDLIAVTGIVESSIPNDDDDDSEDDWARRPVAELARRILAGDHEPERPEHGLIEGAIPLFYPGRIHSIFGPPGGGKTWVGLYVLAERLQAGEHCAMFDWEDAEQGTTQRLLQLGCTPDDLERFSYFNPSSSLKWGWPLIEADPSPWTMIVIDSAGEALAAQGIELNDDKGTAQWFQLAKKLARRPERPSIVMLDHVPKNGGDEPAKMAIGSQRKLAAITGASYRCDTLVEPARGKDGKLKLVTAKDRLGNRAKGSTACEVHMHDEGDQLIIRLTISEAQAAHERGEKFRPTHLMERVSRWLEINPGATRRAIEKDVTGKTDSVRVAIDVLIEEGFVVVERVGKSHEHRVVKDYREAFDRLIQPVHNPSTPQVRPSAPLCAPSAPQGAVNVPTEYVRPLRPRPSIDGGAGAHFEGIDEEKTKDMCAPPDAPRVDAPNPTTRPATLEEYGL